VVAGGRKTQKAAYTIREAPVEVTDDGIEKGTVETLTEMDGGKEGNVTKLKGEEQKR